MLGPSPDWNVGLSAEDLCTKECGWVQKLVQDLIPWDAGTDSGVTYEVSVRVLDFPQSHRVTCVIQSGLRERSCATLIKLPRVSVLGICSEL